MSRTRIINFPDARLQEFIADLRRTGSALIDLADPSDVASFRDRVRRECRRLRIRARTGCTDAMKRDADGTEHWTYGRRVYACDIDWEITPEQELYRRLAIERLAMTIDGHPSWQ